MYVFIILKHILELRSSHKDTSVAHFKFLNIILMIILFILLSPLISLIAVPLAISRNFLGMFNFMSNYNFYFRIQIQIKGRDTYSKREDHLLEIDKRFVKSSSHTYYDGDC